MTSALLTYEELQARLKAGQLRDWMSAHFSSSSASSSSSSSSSLTVERLFSAIVTGSLRADSPFEGVALLRAVLQALPPSRLNALVLPEDLLAWLSSFAIKTETETDTLTPAQRAAALSVLVQLLKGCSLLQNTHALPQFVRALQSNLDIVHGEVAALSTVQSSSPDATAAYVANMMVLHQLEDIVSILGANHDAQIAHALSLSLPRAIALLPLLRVGRERLQSVYGDQFDLDVAKVVGMVAEAALSLCTPAHNAVLALWPTQEARSEALRTLVSGAGKLVDALVSSELAHDAWLSALHNSLSLSLLLFAELDAARESEREEVREQLRALYLRVLASVDELSLEDVVSAKRVELLVGAVSSFFDAPLEHSSLSVYHSVLLEENEEEFDASLITSLIESVSSLQIRMKEKLSAVARHATQAKDFKIIFSDLRKGCISTLDRVFSLDKMWLSKSAARRKIFWELCVKSLSTPLLFASAYPALCGQRVFLGQVVAFLQKALAALENYSLVAAEDIVETVKQLVQNGCPEIATAKTISLLQGALNLSPKSLSPTDLQAQWKWKTSICLTLQEVFVLLSKLVGEEDGSEIDCVEIATEAVSLSRQLFSEVLVEHVRSSSAFAASQKGKQGKKNNVEDMDGSVDLFHATMSAASAACDFLLFAHRSRALQSNSIVSEQQGFTWKGSAMLCLESALKPLVFDDDLVDVLLSLELLARCAALHVVVSGLSGEQSFNDDIFTAALVAIAVAGPLSKNDAVSERLLGTLKLFVQDALSGASSLSDKTLFEQFTNMLKDASVTEEANETVFIAAKAAMSSLVENVGLTVNATEVSNNRLSLLKTTFSNNQK